MWLKKRKKKSPPAVSTVIIPSQLTYFNGGLRKNKLSSSSNIIETRYAERTDIFDD